MQNIRLIVVDLDGTILRDDKSIDRGLIDAINKLKEREVKFTFATGRNIYSTMEVARQLPLELPFAINNGAMIISKNEEILVSWTIAAQFNNQLLSFLHDYAFPFLAYSDEAIVVDAYDPLLDKFRQYLSDKLAVHEYAGSEDFSDFNFYKILINADGKTNFDIFQSSLNQNFPQVRLLGNEGSTFVLNAPEVSKGKALKRLCKEIGVDLEETMVIGDNHNDLSMLEVSGLAVAMGNAERSVLEMADLCIGHNNDDAVSTFLKKYFSL